jgi:hypothetical protein
MMMGTSKQRLIISQSREDMYMYVYMYDGRVRRRQVGTALP